MTEKKAILCVDDEPLNLMLLETYFAEKYKVFMAGSGYNGLEILKAHPEIAIVLSDMKMPGMNGVEFIKQARRDHPTIIYIILTGYDITDEIMKALNEKIIHEYFQKPYNIRDIEVSIDHVFP